MIKQKLDSLIGNSENLTTEFKLISYQLNPETVNYLQHSESKKLDTVLVVSNDFIKYRTIDRIISPLRLIDIGQDIKSPLYRMRNRYFFLTKIPDHQLGIYNNEQLGLLIDIKPDFQSHFSGLFSAARDINKSWYLTGEMDFHLENIWRTAGQLNIYWQKLDSTSQTLRMHMFEPHPFGWTLGTDWSYSHEIVDGLFTDLKTKAAVQIPGYILGSFYFGYVSGKIIPTGRGQLNGYLKSRFQGLTVMFEHNSHNSRFLPKHGSLMNFNTDFGIQDDITYIQAEIEADHHFSLNENWNIVTSLWGKMIVLDQGDVSEARQIRFGGINRLRGYRDKEFRADAVSIPTIEFHYQPSEYWRTEFFIDTGLIKGLDYRPIGLGIGFSQLNDSALIQVQYALSKRDGFMEGKLHLKWISRL